jgi:hypothetical protein
MFVESFWRNRIKINGKVIIKDSETSDPIGKGLITAILRILALVISVPKMLSNELM